MDTELPFVVWACALLAAVSFLCSIGYTMAHRKTWAAAYLVLGLLFALASAVTGALFAGGYITP